MFIAFGGFASQNYITFHSKSGLAKFASGAVFPVGLMLVVIAGAELLREYLNNNRLYG